MDDDGDGITDDNELSCGSDPLDVLDTPVDTDGDGLPNCLDTDDDNDGVIDATEVTDGTNPLDPCSLVFAHQTLQEGISNWDQLDCDGDGIQNQYELQASFSTTSRDLSKVYQALDTDGDGIFNHLDTDDDGDGILTAYEFPDANGDGIPDDALDSDGEQVPNYLDTDDDGDGIPTTEEFPDANGDGIPDDALDSDGEQVPNYLDIDDDNDGVLTIEEALSPEDPFKYQDTDGDGLPNYLDIDDDNDGIISLLENELGTSDLNEDTDGDGVLDGVEYNEDGTDPLNPCSLVLAHQTVQEGIDNWNRLDCDLDGVLNELEVIETVDFDNDGIPNYLDIDDDNDELLTEQELLLGTNYYNVDTDDDGVTDGVEFDTDETNPLDSCSLIVAHQTEERGIAIWNLGDCDGDGLINEEEALLDSDQDGLWNYIDIDDDGDGLLTNLENPDPNQNGSSEDSFDSDNDGIPDYFDVNQFTSSETVAKDIEIYNALSPNGDGFNDVFTIRNIEMYPDNELTIFNGWGTTIYKTTSYGQYNRFFTGHNSNGNSLPEGVYYYILIVRDGENTQTFKGYLYINR
jgi:gliding motility-associated-like protein